MDRRSRRDVPTFRRSRRSTSRTNHRAYRRCDTCGLHISLANWARHVRSRSHVEASSRDSIARPENSNYHRHLSRSQTPSDRTHQERSPSYSQESRGESPVRDIGRGRPRESLRRWCRDVRRQTHTDSPRRYGEVSPSSSDSAEPENHRRSSSRENLTRQNLRRLLTAVIGSGAGSYREYVMAGRMAAPWAPDSVVRMAAVAADLMPPMFRFRRAEGSTSTPYYSEQT